MSACTSHCEPLPSRFTWSVIQFAIVLAFLAAFTCGTSEPSFAQSCIQHIGDSCAGDYGVRWPPGSWCYADGVPRVCNPCYINSCPKNAPGETCPKCPSAGHPISLLTGNTYIVQTDITLPGLAGGTSLVRTWNSIWPSTQTGSRDGMCGRNWRSTYEERVFVGSDGTVKYSRADGSFWSFVFTANISESGHVVASKFSVVAPADISAVLMTGDSFWTLTFQNGEKRLFDNVSGSLTSIIDRNGNTVQLSYDGANRLTTVTDAAGRHLNFTYAAPSSYLVTAITSDAGVSVTYSYDTQGRLSSVTEPDETTLSFEYDARSYITAVKDSDGKILESHTYDDHGRGLTSSRANGVDAVIISYPEPLPPWRSE